MVELIFVIIIIGILAAAAIPKFGDIKDKAKINSEYNTLSGLDGAIEAQIQFQEEAHNNIGVSWHNQSASDTYATINTQKKVLSKIVKKGDDLKIVKYIAVDENGTASTTDDDLKYDVLFIEGAASNHTVGVKQPSDGDIANRPDKNDVWVFNASPNDIIITGSSITDVNVSSGELKLIDATETLDYNTAAKFKVTFEGDTTALTVAAP